MMEVVFFVLRYCKIIYIYYIDTGVLLKNIPLVKFKKQHPGPECFFCHYLTREFIDDFIDIKFVS